MNCVMCKKETRLDKGFYKMGETHVCFECAAKFTLDAIFIRANNEGVSGIESKYSPAIESDGVVYADATPEQVEAFFNSDAPVFLTNKEANA